MLTTKKLQQNLLRTGGGFVVTENAKRQTKIKQTNRLIHLKLRLNYLQLQIIVI